MEIIKPFQPYFDKKLGHVTSRKQEEKLLGKKGFSYINDHHAMKQEAKYIVKHREEYIQAEYAKQGLKYKPGSNVIFDEKSGRFIPRPR
jgi:hypothetical protein